MITTWLLMGVFAIIAIFLFNIDLEDGGILMIIAVIVTAIIGFWVTPEIGNYQIQIKKITPTEIVKSSTTVYVEFEKYENKSYTDKKTYENIDSLTFYLYSYYDKYGELNGENIQLGLNEEKDTIYIGKGIVEYD